MGKSKLLWASVMTLLAIAFPVASAQASKLVLRSAGNVVAPGAGAKGTLQFGPCGSFSSTGTLTDNGSMLDRAAFTTFENSPGGCGEGGPSATGQLERMQVSGNGSMMLFGAITYRTEIPNKCEYTLTRMMGKFTIPGPTSSKVSGTAKRVSTGSEHGCKGAIHLTGEEAALDDLASGLPFETELG